MTKVTQKCHAKILTIYRVYQEYAAVNSLYIGSARCELMYSDDRLGALCVSRKFKSIFQDKIISELDDNDCFHQRRGLKYFDTSGKRSSNGTVSFEISPTKLVAA